MLNQNLNELENNVENFYENKSSESINNNLISVDELKLLFKFNNIETTLTDEELEKLIEFQQQSMLAELGITLDPVKHTFIYYPNYTEPRKQARVPITLPLVNVISIDKIIINKHHIAEEEDYFFDKKNSVVYLRPRHHHRRWYWAWHWHWYWDIALQVKIDYTTQITDSTILNLLKSLLGDMLVYHQTPSMNKGVTSIKEGDVTVSFGGNSNNARDLPNIINDKKDRLFDLLDTPKVMMI